MSTVSQPDFVLKQAMMQELLSGRTRLLSPDAGTKMEAKR